MHIIAYIMFLDLQFIADLICHCLPSLDVIEYPVIKTLHVAYHDSSHLVAVVAGFSGIILACVKFLGCSLFQNTFHFWGIFEEF